MIKNYQRLWALVAFSTLVTCKVLSQPLSGNYTIDNTSPSSATNFTSFTQFASTVNVQGVAGGGATVTVNGQMVYNEQVEFTNASMTATNALTINGNGRTLTFSATASALPHTLMLSGADFMTVKNLTVSGTGGTYALTVHLWNSANNNTFLNCSIDAPLGAVSTQVPLSISGTSVSATAAGVSGNNNTVTSCTMTGGYYGTTFYGNTSTPFNTGNSIFNSRVVDFYQSGCYNAYCQSSTFKSNIIERQNRLSVTTTYGIIGTTGSINTLIDGNFLRNLFNGITGSGSVCYPIYVLGAATPGNENVIKNNVVSDINSNGTIIGIFISGGSYANVFHNTISLDDQTATSGTTYGIECTGASCQIKNNIVTLTRSGSGAKYGLYLTTAASNLQSDYNDIYVSSISGSGNVPFFLTNGYTLAQWQAAYLAYDQGSKSANPLYTNPSLLNYVPTSTVINNMCAYVGVALDFNGVTRSTQTPDPGAFETYTTVCTSAAPSNTVVTPSYVVCPNTTLNLSLVNTFTNTGYSVQWQSSTTSSLGPFSAIPGATLNSYNTGLLSTTIYYNAVITCVNGGTTTATAGVVSVAQQTISNVPYYESFEGIAFTNQLPNCSWFAPFGGSARTYTATASNNRYPRTGFKFAAFASSNAPGYFYTNGINLVPGVTYSAALWYVNETVGYYPWNEIAILLGSSQTTTGLSTIATTTAAANGYMLLSNTFSVSTPGIYYLAIRGVSAPGSSPFLTWDDLSVTIPCSLNAPQVFINSFGTTVCSNQTLALTGSGADTYEWTSNVSGSSVLSSNAVLVVPTGGGTSYFVKGTNSLSGCSSSASVIINVLPAPVLGVFTTSSSICEGQSAVLNAIGAGNLSWSNGALGTPVTVSPMSSTTYTVIGVAPNGCSATQTVAINVSAKPTVSATASSYKLCKGDMVTLTGSGADNYQWTDNAASVLYGSPLSINVQSSGGYTMTGTTNSGCSATAYFVLDVSDCTGINEQANAKKISVYPNPARTMLTIASEGNGPVSAEVTDVTGRIVITGTPAGSPAELNISQLPDGVYSVKVTTPDAVRFVKIVKAQ